MKKKMIIPIILGFFSTACTNINPLLSTSQTNMEIVVIAENGDLLTGNPKKFDIMKVITPVEECKGYLASGSRCKFYKELPEKMQFHYSVIEMPKINPNEVRKDFDYARRKAENLPISAWKTYTIYPKQVFEKAKTMPVLVNGELKPYDPAIYPRGTTVTLILSIDNQGKITQEVEHEIIYRNNPAA